MTVNRIYILLVFILLFSCTKKERVIFQIPNNSSASIFVEYFVIETNDTTNVEILMNNAHIISDVLLAEGKTTNWYSDYPVHINLITNLAGDTINFDPNEAANWQFYAQSSVNYYNLSIGNSSF